jgi:hypothetical protein
LECIGDDMNVGGIHGKLGTLRVRKVTRWVEW